LITVEEGGSDLQHIHEGWSRKRTDRVTISINNNTSARQIGVRGRDLIWRDEQSLEKKDEQEDKEVG
jgi:hypothetical protein